MSIFFFQEKDLGVDFDRYNRVEGQILCGLSDKIYMEWVLHIFKHSWSRGFSFYHVPPSVHLLPTWTIGFKRFRTCKKSLDYSYALLGPAKQDMESGRYDKYLVSPQLSDSDNLRIDM